MRTTPNSAQPSSPSCWPRLPDAADRSAARPRSSPTVPSALSVVAAAIRTPYTGQCLPSSERAPPSESIVSVTHGPTTITHQWVTGDGGGDGGGSDRACGRLHSIVGSPPEAKVHR
jgi:hypothetical protein